jgi:hypothetical protein
VGRGRWLLRNEAVSSVVGPLLTEGHSGAVSFLTHGRDDALHLHDTVVCAASPEQRSDPGPDADHRPVCAFTGRCFRSEIPPEQILSAHALVVDTVFANACVSWRVADGLFPSEYLLSHGFMSGTAVGYVGSLGLISGSARRSR